MSVTATEVSAATTATQLFSAAADSAHGDSVVIQNVGAADVFIGGSAVATTTGFKLAAAASTPLLPLRPGESVHGIVATGTVAVRVLAITGA